MALSNTLSRYGSVAKSFHWMTALGIVSMIPLGIIATDMPYDTAEQLARKATLFSVHKTLGVFLFFVALGRILWALTQTKPAGLHPDRKAETFMAELVHWLLYASLVVVPLSGWVHHAATEGFAPIWGIGQNLPFVPENERLSEIAASLHVIFEKVLLISLVLHIAGAVKHHVIDKDSTLKRMLPRATVTDAAPQAERHSAWPALAAGLVWIGAVGLGAGMGMFAPHSTAPTTVALAEVQSDWRKESGEIGLTIRQFGSEVEGQFADWTAQITFEDGPEPGKKGEVTVEIAIASLELGTVRDQAMGPDFFDATAFPKAIFTADILRAADGYVAEGALTIKDQSVPVTLPFQLRVVGEHAEMEGRVTLDRRSFGIGDNMTDEGQLGFVVEIDITLNASRSAE